MQASRVALTLLRVATAVGQRSDACGLGWAASRLLSESAHAVGLSAGPSSPAPSWWGRLSFGLAAAGAGVTFATSAASASAPTTEYVVSDGVKVTTSGGAKVKHQVVFVLGGPGSGKGTQCARLTSEFSDVAHFSAGDLLREHVKSGTPDGNAVNEMIKQGQIVPAEVTVGLLQQAMASSGKTKILIDGFPRNDSNREVFQRLVGYDCEAVLYFDCPEQVLEARLLGRNQGRVDDNIETIEKRFKVFLEQSLPVIEHYRALGKVRTIDTNRPVETIYQEVRQVILALGSADN